MGRKEGVVYSSLFLCTSLQSVVSHSHYHLVSLLILIPHYPCHTKIFLLNSVVVAIAMEAEAAPFVEHLKLVKQEGFFPAVTPFHCFTGTYNGGTSKVTVVTNGKDHIYETGVDNCGTVPAAMATFLALSLIKDADILINAGTCGGFSRKGAAIGDVFLTTGVANHDRRIPIPDFIPYGVGKLSSKINSKKLAEQHNFKLGVCTTGNSLDKTDEDDKHMLANDASVKDMEAAAIAWSCELHKMPFMGIKVVTDIVDGDRPSHEEFMENLGAASKSLQEALPQVLEYILGKEHHEL
jgi:5'-methylthioadenosine nucleosidase